MRVLNDYEMNLVSGGTTSSDNAGWFEVSTGTLDFNGYYTQAQLTYDYSYTSGDTTYYIGSDYVIANNGQNSVVYWGNNYSASGEVYSSDQGLSFSNFGSCVNYYANEYHDQTWESSGWVPVIGDVVGAVNSIIGNGDPTNAEIQAAINTCR